MGRDGCQNPSNRQSKGGQPQHPFASGPQLTDIQGEAAFEHDDRNRQLDHRPQGVPERISRTQDLQPWSDEQSDRE